MSEILTINVRCDGCGNEFKIRAGSRVDTRCSVCSHSVVILEPEDGRKKVTFRCVNCDNTFLCLSKTPVQVYHLCNKGGRCWIVDVEPEASPEAMTEKVVTKRERKDLLSSEVEISIIIAVWDNLPLIRNCLETIFRFSKGLKYQLVLVDNGSTPDTASFLQSAVSGPDVLIRNPANLGFIRANNQGLALSTGKYILLLNADTLVQAPNWWEPLKSALAEADLVGPTPRKVRRVGQTFEFVGDGKLSEQFSYLEGWCLFARREYLIGLGGCFDEETLTKVYCEDVDLSWRVRKSGGKLAVAEKVPIRHLGGSCVKRIGYLGPVNNKTLFQKWREHFRFPVENIQVIREGAIGDVLMTTPIIRALHRKYGVPVDLVTSCPQLVERNPHIRRITTTAVGNGVSYDLSVQLEYEKDMTRNWIDVMAEQAGVRLESRRMDYFFSQKAQVVGEKKLASIHTGKSWPCREWPLIHWSAVVDWLSEKGYTVVQLGDSNTPLLSVKGNVVDLRGAEWDTVAHWIKHSEFFLGIDSGPSNLAKAVRTPAFILYGPTDPSTHTADAEEIPLVNPELDCLYCRNKVPGSIHVECKKGHPAPCMDTVTPNYVIKTISLWQEARKGKGRGKKSLSGGGARE